MSHAFRDRIRQFWPQFCQLLFSPIPGGAESRAWSLAAGSASLFAVGSVMVQQAPTLGHLLLFGNLGAIVIPAKRSGWCGAWGGLLLCWTGLVVTTMVGSLTATSQGFPLSEMALTMEMGLVVAFLAGRMGESIVHHRELAHKVAAAEGRLATLINAMPPALLLLSRGGKIHFSNIEARHLLSTDAPEEFGLSLRDLVSPEDWIEFRRRVFEPTRGEPFRATIPGEVPVRTEWVFAPFEDDGELRTLAFFWNAEERFRREEESGALTAALRSLQEGVVLAHLDGTVRYANPAATQIYGFAERRDLVGTHLKELLAPSARPDFETRMEQARTVGGAAEIRLLRPDGNETEVHVTTSPVHVDGVLIGTIGVIRDLTEAKVIARRATAADKQAALGRLVAGAAHEINNPLTAILANAELVRVRTDLPTEVAAQMEVILAECTRAGRIVRDLLAFARQRPVTRSCVELADVVREAVALREGYARAAGIDLTLRTPSGAPVQVDADQIKQVVLNLLLNAEDAVRSCEKRRIVVTIGRRGERALLLVNDSGPGVPEALQQQIFEPFFTTKPEGHGTGLGLAVSCGIITEHGGRINVSTGLLGGAQFAMELPLAIAQAPSVPTIGVAPSLRSTNRLRILVVDDEPAILSSVGRILQRLGHQVSTAATGGDAFGLALAEPFDVILSDLRMPGMSGRELHAALTAEGVLPGTDFIVATGDIADPEAFEFLQATGLPVLLKPFEIRHLVELLARCRSGPRVGLVLERAG
jgi:PAS domain S-box-containing protein